MVYDEEKESWVVANKYRKWHDYSNQEWANAVILEDGVTKEIGDTVLVPTDTSATTEVKAMYVWIPRYSYTIKSEDGTNYYGKTISSLGGSTASLSTPGAIDIKFISTDIVETGTAQYTGNTATNWHTHPAFQWDTNSDGTISSNENIKGIWVGKFETTGTGTTPTVLPNVQSLRGQNVSTQFSTSQIFSTYLINSTNVDSHMMKNSEWGAVAYLSQSIYGKYGNSDYIGQYKEVYINNSSSYYTGHSNGAYSKDSNLEFDNCLYNDITNRSNGIGSCGGGASTTGNITSIYDMSGGADEYVMAYLTTASSTWGASAEGNYAGFTKAPDRKYFDAYTTTTDNISGQGIYYGQALYETKKWYSGFMGYLTLNYPWYSRGNGTKIGGEENEINIFYANACHGDERDNRTFRNILLKE